jgi:hypothetical protein
MAYKNVEDRKAYHKNWYAENKARRVQQIRAYQAREHGKFAAYKATLSCCVCGYARCARALEFHHLDGETKEAEINKMLQHDKASFVRLMREIAKCRVLCANCHRELHDGLIELPA